MSSATVKKATTNSTRTTSILPSQFMMHKHYALLPDVKEVVHDDFEQREAHDDYFTTKPDATDKLGFTSYKK
jgi:hypothetical protein